MLPNQWNQTVFDFPCVICIAVKFLAKHGFLILNTDHDDEGIEGKWYQPPKRVENEGERQEHKKRCEIHGMAYHAVKPRINDLLILLHLNGT